MEHPGRIGLCLCLLAFPAHAAWFTSGDLSYSLDAPIGWVLDRSMAAQAEADLVLYPQGTSYQKADSLITLSISDKPVPFAGIEDLAQKDEAEIRRSDPKLEVHRGPVLQTQTGRNVPLHLFTGLKDGGAQAVAYLEEGEHVMVFVLSCPSPAVLHEDLPALKEAVGSFGSRPGLPDP